MGWSPCSTSSKRWISPPELWTAHFEVSISLACDGMGQTQLVDPVGWMHYVHPVHGTEIREPVAAPRLRRPRGCPGYELVALDVGGFPSNSSWPIDATACSAGRKIGIYFDPAATICQGTIRPGSLGTLYVVAKLEPGSGSIAGAEFRIVGIPASWSAFPVANPELVAFGNPFEAGVTMAFPCYASDRERLVLYTVFILASSVATDVQFSLEAKKPGQCGFVVPVAGQLWPCVPPRRGTLLCERHHADAMRRTHSCRSAQLECCEVPLSWAT